LGLQEKVDRGERLSDQDLAFLNEALANAQDLKSYVDRNPDAQSVYAQVVGLDKAITEKALSNEGDALPKVRAGDTRGRSSVDPAVSGVLCARETRLGPDVRPLRRRRGRLPMSTLIV